MKRVKGGKEEVEQMHAFLKYIAQQANTSNNEPTQNHSVTPSKHVYQSRAKNCTEALLLAKLTLLTCKVCTKTHNQTKQTGKVPAEMALVVFGGHCMYECSFP